MRGGRAVLPDHLAISVYVDGQKREALGILPGSAEFGLEAPAVPQTGQSVALVKIECGGVARWARWHFRSGAQWPGGTGTLLEGRGEDLDPAHEVPVVEEQRANPLAPGLAEPGGQRRVAQQLDDRIAERGNVGRIGNQQAAVPVPDLLEVTGHRAGAS